MCGRDVDAKHGFCLLADYRKLHPVENLVQSERSSLSVQSEHGQVSAGA